MAKIDRLEYKDDYVQSANSLFHFMYEERFLTDAIDRCALIPRYCKENIEYMVLKDTKGKTVKEMAVLQKCFCDIPFHKICLERTLNLHTISLKMDHGLMGTHMGLYTGLLQMDLKKVLEDIAWIGRMSKVVIYVLIHIRITKSCRVFWKKMGL